MKKLALLSILLFIIGTLSVNASTLIEPFTYESPYSDTFDLYTETGVTQASLINYLGVDSCYEQVNYESKHCQYVYWCYAILPSNSIDIGDALQRECLDITEVDKDLVIKDFVPPVGILYYVTTFVTIVDYTYNDALTDWNTPTASIPETDGHGHQLINAQDIRSVCQGDMMLGLERDITGVPIKQKCYIAERVCLDTTETGLCTNPYPLYVLDIDGDGSTDDEFNAHKGSSFCADRNKDKICDIVVSLWAVDVCSGYVLTADGTLYCAYPQPNGIDDAADQASLFSCKDNELSPNPFVCDTIDIEGCIRNYDPVCVDTGASCDIQEDCNEGRCVSNTCQITYPNDCFAEGQGYISVDWEIGLCENPLRQCVVPEDCPMPPQCLGGTSTIQRLCLADMCSYSGACQNAPCSTDADCEFLNDPANIPCAGVIASCENEVCIYDGKCIEAPQPTKFSIWSLIQNIFTAFFNFIKSIFGG